MEWYNSSLSIGGEAKFIRRDDNVTPTGVIILSNTQSVTGSSVETSLCC